MSSSRVHTSFTGTPDLPCARKRFRDRRRLDDVVAGGIRAPAEAPTRVEHVEFHLLGLESVTVCATANWSPVWNCSPFQTSQPASVSFTTQFNGSIAACAR